MPMSALLKNHYKSPFLEINGYFCDKPVATDTIYSDTPAIDYGSKYTQLFVGAKSLVSDVHGMKTYKQFLNTL